MLDFFIRMLACILGCFIGNLLSRLYELYRTKKTIFSTNYFKDVDFDFYSDKNDKSITDIDIEKGE